MSICLTDLVRDENEGGRQKRVTYFLHSQRAVRNIPTYPTAGFEPSPGIIQQAYAWEMEMNGVRRRVTCSSKAVLKALNPRII
jgi:hypothetical protein